MLPLRNTVSNLGLRHHFRMDEQRVPTLRFPEFEEEWILKRIDEIAPLQRGFDLPTSQVIPGDYPVVYSNGIARTHTEFRANAPGVVTGRSGTIGSITYVTNNYWPHNTSLWVTDFYSNHSKFIYYFFHTIKLERFGTGSGVPTLNRNDIHTLKRAIPEPLEQQKIADFLSTVDTKIEQLTCKKELLEQYKKGVMQKLFPKPGEQHPKLRFKQKDGSDFPDWEVKRLGEVLEICYGKDYKHLNEGSIPLLGTGGIMTYVDNFLYDQPSVLIGRKGSIKTPQFIEEPFWTVDTLFYTKVLDNTIPYYAYLLVTVINLLKYNEASGVPSLSASTLSAINVSIPISINEQSKIAEFIRSIDKKISAVINETQKAQIFKKGLLQQMFV